MSKILIMPDVKGWACDTIADAVIEHINHDFTKRYTADTKLVPELENFDLVYIMLLRPAWNLLSRFEAEYDRPFKAPVVTGFHSFRELEVPGLEAKLERFKAVNAVSRELFNILIRIEDPERVHCTPSGVDVDRFRLGRFEEVKFRVVWAGNPLHHWKRTWLLDQLSSRYSIDRAEGYVPEEDMPRFYRGADALIIVSRDEGGPLTALEASASGIPVISTRVGIVPDLIDSDWIVDDGVYWKMPDLDIIRAFDELLGELKADAELRWEVGMRNRRVVERDWTWERRSRAYGKFLEAAMR